MDIIDFSQYAKNIHSYGGSDNKKCIKMNGRVYMVKLPNRKENPNSLQTNVSSNVISEYIGSHIMQSLGLDTQNTLLGYWGKDIVVACEDFREGGWELQHFAWVMQDIIDQSKIGRIPTYEQLYTVFEKSPILHDIRQEALERYWDIIAADALIGNFDRHKDNFGYLVKDGEFIKNAPIYDCGSCLYPDLSEEKFQDVLSDPKEIELRVYQFPKIALNKNSNKNREEKFGYFELLSSGFDKECTKAFFRIYDRINIEKINDIIENTPFISDIRKNFYKKMISYRKELIFDKSYELLTRQKG